MAARPAAYSNDLPAVPRVIVPRQTTDPIWSLKSWPVVLSIGGRDWEIPAASAADWLSVLMPSPVDLDEIIMTMVTNGESLLFDESVGGELENVMLDVISLVSGRPWWQTLRMIAVAVNNWNVLGGEMLYRGIIPDQVSLSQWLDVLLLVTIRSMDPKDVTMFTLQLENPPVEVVDSVAEEMEMSRDQFLSMAR